MAVNLDHESHYTSNQLQFTTMTTNQRIHAKTKQRPADKWTNLIEQNQQRLITAPSSGSCGTATRGRYYEHLHFDHNDNRFGVNSMQTPSMITRAVAVAAAAAAERPQRRKRSLGCLSAGGRAGACSSMMRPIRLTFNGNVTPAALVIGLIHQIVIVSLILHKLPALIATRAPITSAITGPSTGNGVDQFTTMTFNHHLGNNLHNFNQRQQGYLIGLPTLIYTDQLLGGSLSGRAEQNITKERQRPSLQTKEPQEEATNSEIGNNQRQQQQQQQQEARSFIKTRGEIVNDNELMQTVRRHGLPSAHWQQQQQRNPTAAADDNRHDHARRAKRHLGPILDEDSLAMVAAEQYVSATPLPPSQPAHAMATTSKRTSTPDCHKLTALWLYLQSNYPTLVSNLVELATEKKVPKAGQLARSIDHILGDAERLTAAVTRPHKAAATSLANLRHSPAWLARISPNSVYGKLVQHLRVKQLNQQLQRPSSSGVVPEEELAQEANESAQRQQPTDSLASEPDDANGEQMVSSMSQPQAASSSAATTSQVVYGRLVNYPHEIGLAADNSHGMARTLEKLRLLNQHSKHQRQQQLASGDIVETNKIPLAAADLADQTVADRSKLAESATDLARNNFVYGTMLLHPSNIIDQDKQRSPPPPFNHHHQHHQQHQRPMGTLRELANEQEHQRLIQSGQSQLPIKTAAGSGQISSSSSDTNYGRILTSPPSDNKHSDNNNDKSDLIQTTDDSGGGASASDELVVQQSVGSAAAAAAAESGNGDGDEFEGEFHSSPLKQAEVRLLRSLDHQQQQPSSSGAVQLMQQSQAESVATGADFLID